MAKQQFDTRTIYLPERLEHKLDDIFHYPCTTVVAPAGFGKSTCVREFLDCGTEGDAPLVLWRDVPDGDDSYFLEDLAAAFHTLSRDFSEFLLSSGIPEDKQSRHLFFKRLVELNLSFLQEIVVVLDMGEAVVSERIRNFIEFFIQNLPVRFHIVLIGRQRLLPRGSKLPFYSRINAVTWRNLKFTAVDIENIIGDAVFPRRRKTRRASNACPRDGSCSSGSMCRNIWSRAGFFPSRRVPC